VPETSTTELNVALGSGGGAVSCPRANASAEGTTIGSVTVVIAWSELVSGVGAGPDEEGLTVKLLNNRKPTVMTRRSTMPTRRAVGLQSPPSYYRRATPPPKDPRRAPDFAALVPPRPAPRRHFLRPWEASCDRRRRNHHSAWIVARPIHSGGPRQH